MLKAEKKVIAFIEKNSYIFFFFAFSIMGALMRYTGRNFISSDMVNYLLPWFNVIKENGGLAALSQQIGTYNILYQFIIAVFTYIDFGTVYMYKCLSIFFDYALAAGVAYTVYKICKPHSKALALITYALVLFSPTVILNSAFWGQCDSTYVCFLVPALYFLYKQKFPWAFIMLGLSFGFKLQAIFLVPFFLIYYFVEKKFSIFNFLYTLIVFLLSGLPGYIAGRPLNSLFDIYSMQVEIFTNMYFVFPSFWAFVSETQSEFLRPLAMFVTIGVLGLGLFFFMHKKTDMGNALNFFTVASWSVWTCVLFLPSMHERYAYPLDILLIIVAVLDFKYAPFALITTMISLFCYACFLFDAPINLPLLALIYCACYALFSIKLIKHCIKPKQA